jgi:hypothetical protein
MPRKVSVREKEWRERDRGWRGESDRMRERVGSEIYE